ncbi:MAG: DUF1405 domain-containing protein [Halodesulfurarchaeum sp.]
MALIPRRIARFYLENTWVLLSLIVANFLAVLVGVDFYVKSMPKVYAFLWPFFTDSPGATFLMLLSLVSLVPNLGNRLEAATQNRPLAYLHTLAFVWLLKYGLWTVVALNLGFSAYFPDLWAYWGILLTHLGLVAEAFLIPHYGRTTTDALVFALSALLLDDVLDYGLGLHPALRYDPGVVLPAATVILSLLSVGLAHRQFDRLEGTEPSSVR